MSQLNPHDRVVLIMEEPRGPSQLVEVLVNQAGLQRVYFPDVQQLRTTQVNKILLKGMRLITPEVLISGVLNQAETAPVTELQKMVLVLYSEQWEKAQYIPLLTLNDTTVPGGSAAHRYAATKFNNWFDVDWSKSYIQYSAGNVSVLDEGAPYVVLFDVDYVKIDGTGAEILGAS